MIVVGMGEWICIDNYEDDLRGVLVDVMWGEERCHFVTIVCGWHS